MAYFWEVFLAPHLAGAEAGGGVEDGRSSIKRGRPNRAKTKPQAR
jgi:hypothetical protein